MILLIVLLSMCLIIVIGLIKMSCAPYWFGAIAIVFFLADRVIGQPEYQHKFKIIILVIVIILFLIMH